MSGLGGLAFLAGSWRGEGTLRGRPVTSVSEARPSANSPGALSLRTRTLRDGAVIHEEEILWMPDPGAAVRCVTRPRSDEEQVWRVRELEGGGAWELTHPGNVWTVRRTADGYEETYDEVTADGARRTVVALRHVRDEGPRR